jgi:hypothetical protein
MKISILVAIGLLSICSLKIKAQDIHSLRLPTKVSLDGDPSEWPQPFRYYDGATKLQFAVANDTANLYICLKITDDPTQARLFTAGLTIWVDPKGKKKELMGLVFPVKGDKDASEGVSKHHQQGEQDVDPATRRGNMFRMKHHAMLEQTTLRVKGFVGLPEQVLPLKNNYGVNAAFNWDSLDILTIEYQVPLALIFGRSLATTDTLKPIGIGFVESPLEAPKKQGDESESNGMNSNSSVTGANSGGMGRGGMGGGGMGGGSRGGGGHGGMGGGMGEQNPATVEQKVWSKIILNYSNK